MNAQCPALYEQLLQEIADVRIHTIGIEQTDKYINPRFTGDLEYYTLAYHYQLFRAANEPGK